nr:MAG TPA: hypothetical protein [Caudoviricetes sp.]DAS43587.1 MAG TPA: hypothetical protein [Caudoviricetes sp.]
MIVSFLAITSTYVVIVFPSCMFMYSLFVLIFASHYNSTLEIIYT